MLARLLVGDWNRYLVQVAAPNAGLFITFAWAGHFAWFTYQRCREAELDAETAQQRALQLGAVAVFAFFPFRIELLWNLDNIPVASLRHLVLGVGAAKMLIWTYLLSVLFRYYFLSGRRVFTNMISLWPRGKRAPDVARGPEEPDPKNASEDGCA